MNTVSCPSCGSNDTYYSAVWLSWKCEICGNPFDRPQGSSRTATRSKTAKTPAEKKPKLVLQVGEQDKAGGTLLRREPIDGVIHDIWSNPQNSRFIFAIPRTDNTGTVLSRYMSEEDANKAFDEKLAACPKKEEPEQSTNSQ